MGSLQLEYLDITNIKGIDVLAKPHLTVELLGYLNRKSENVKIINM